VYLDAGGNLLQPEASTPYREQDVNGFDVQAVGWLVTRDLCCHATSALLGFKPAITRRGAEELFSQWQTLIDAVD
jgi:hypothetical protein